MNDEEQPMSEKISTPETRQLPKGLNAQGEMETAEYNVRPKADESTGVILKLWRRISWRKE